MCKSKALIDKALSYVGYLEKASDKDLDDFTANAGSKNYTKFCRDYEQYTNSTGFQPSYWCAEFVSCVAVEAFGLAAAKKLLCGSLFASCTVGRDQFKKKNQFHTENPMPGDIVMFFNTKRTAMGHCGIVTEVSSDRITTVEGNTSSGSMTVIDNGGAVAKKTYLLSYERIAGYCRLALDDRDPTADALSGNQIAAFQQWLADTYGYSLAIDGVYGKVTKQTAVKAMQRQLNASKKASLTVDGIWGAKTKAASETLTAGSTGPMVYILQGMLYCYGIDPKGFDGVFGDGCKAGVKAFQRKNFPARYVDGICGPQTWSKLMK